MEYVCRVGTPSGEVVERTFSASDERALRAELEQQGYYLLGIRRGLGLSLLRLRPRRVDPGLLLIFAQELAALLKAGLPLFQSLDVMLDRQRDPVFHQSLHTVREKVKSGVALSDVSFDCATASYDPIPPSGDVLFTLSDTQGSRSVWMCAIDGAGNTTSSAVQTSNTVFLDTVAPNAGTLVLAGGADLIASPLSVGLNLTLPTAGGLVDMEHRASTLVQDHNSIIIDKIFKPKAAMIMPGASAGKPAEPETGEAGAEQGKAPEKINPVQIITLITPHIIGGPDF